MRKLLVASLIAVSGLLGYTDARAAEPVTIAKIVSAVKSHPKSTRREGEVTISGTRNESVAGTRFTLLLPRSSNQFGDMEIVVAETKEHGVHFGIRGGYVVGAKESNYDLDTECVARFSDFGSTGHVGGTHWQCVAWTPTQEEFISKNKQRIYDLFVTEAVTLLNLK